MTQKYVQGRMTWTNPILCTRHCATHVYLYVLGAKGEYLTASAMQKKHH
jgi:hypothetical protein